MKYVATVLSVLVVCALATSPAHAHFKLLAPQSWIVENDLGDPQKAGPCGGTQANPGTPSQAVNKVTGGQKVHINGHPTIVVISIVGIEGFLI